MNILYIKYYYFLLSQEKSVVKRIYFCTSIFSVLIKEKCLSHPVPELISIRTNFDDIFLNEMRNIIFDQ
jgi:hypothetical protein